MEKKDEAQKVVDEIISNNTGNPYLAESLQQRTMIPLDGTTKIMFDNTYCENTCVRSCCKNGSEMPIFAIDIFNLVTSKEGQSLGYKTTEALFKPKINRGKYFCFYLGDCSRAPTCIFSFDHQCPFYSMKNKRGICLLGENRPTICKARPFARIVDEEGTVFFYYSPLNGCEGARRGAMSKEILTITNFIDHRKLKERYVQVQRHHNIVKLCKNITNKNDVLDIACKLFNPDYFFPKKLKPIFKSITYEEHITNIQDIIEHMLEKQK